MYLYEITRFILVSVIVIVIGFVAGKQIVAAWKDEKIQKIIDQIFKRK